MNYILKDRVAIIEPDLIKWAVEFAITNKKVARNRIGDTDISTVFLGTDRGPSVSGQPLLFETMIFGGQHDEYTERCSTWDEAVIQHVKAVELVKSSAH